MIDLEQIADLDWLTITDARGNRCLGPVTVTSSTVTLNAFSTAIPVARRSRANAKLSLLPGLKVDSHQPQLFGEAS